MKIVLQRVKKAKVSVSNTVVGAIDQGIVVFIGVHHNDTPKQAEFLATKCADLRIFSDTEGKMNLSLQDIGGAVLAVSQFTLYGDTSRGRRPSFIEAAPWEKGRLLYEHFVQQLRLHVGKVETGIFGAMMDVELVNDGPVTLILES